MKQRVTTNRSLQITKRHLPHWTVEGATYFVTFRFRQGVMDKSERLIVLQHIKNGDDRFYDLAAAVVMPDHVHVVFRPGQGYALSRIMKGMKGVSARLINESRNRRGTVWQNESYDHIIRSQNELIQKISYMLNNPVKEGLTDDPWTYDGWFCNLDLR